MENSFTSQHGRVLALIILLGTALFGLPADQAATQHQHNEHKPSHLRVDSGTLFTGDGIPIGLHGVTATIMDGSSSTSGRDSKKPADENSKSQVVIIDSGRVFLSESSLTELMNKKIGQEGKVHNLKLTTEQGQIKITGAAKKIIDVPFTLKGPARPTPDGQIELDANSVKAADIPGLAKLLGFDVQKAVGSKAAKGVRAQQNTIIFNPDQLWGLPVHGRVTGVNVQQHGVVLVFGNQQPTSPKSNMVRAAAHVTKTAD